MTRTDLCELARKPAGLWPEALTKGRKPFQGQLAYMALGQSVSNWCTKGAFMPKTKENPSPRPVEVQVNTAQKQKPGDPENQAKLPHERDQSTHMTDQKADPKMQQAHTDLARGLEDTDARDADGKPLGSKRPTK